MRNRFITIIIFSFFQLSLFAQNGFITTWKTDNPGTSGDDQIQINSSSFSNFNVNWEEVGNPSNNGTETGLSGNPIITFPNPGTYRIEITGELRVFNFPGANPGPDDAQKVLSIEQWGNIEWESLSSIFIGCTNMQYNATDAPDLTNVSSISEAFYLCTNFTTGDLTNWNVSGITNMQGAFYLARNFNGDISNWDVSSVTNFSFMLGRTDAFAGDLSSWIVSSGEDFEGMFVGALAFNSDISEWTPIAATNMSAMFKEAEQFNQNLTNWDVSQVTDFSEMFRAINGVSSFNGDLANWPVTSGTDFSDMFRDAIDFNQDLSLWVTSSAENMENMFYQAISFNQNIESWNVDNVTNMEGMFRFASDFNQDLSSWNVTQVGNMANMFDNTDLSICNYNNILAAWSGLSSLQGNVTLGASGIQYSKEAEIERQVLIDTWSWEILDDGDGSISIDAQINDLAVDITPSGGTTPYSFNWVGPSGFNSTNNDIVAPESGTYTLTIDDFGNCTSLTEEFILRESSTAFITTWQTDNPGSTNDNQIQIPTDLTTNSFDVYWEEIGNVDNNGLEQDLTGDPIITFPDPGNYRIEIIGNFPRIYFNNSGDKDKILSIEQWGNISWNSMQNAFAGCINLTSSAADSPDLTGVTSLQGMFSNTSNFNSDISNWDVGRVNIFTDMFLSASAFDNGGVALDWTTVGQSPLVSTISMSTMFSGASNFNQDVSAWDVSKVRTFQRMFLAADAFDNGGVALDWTTLGQSTNVNTISIDRMFSGATIFNQDVSAWDVSKVNSFLGMFESATAFDNGGVALDWTTVGQSPNVSTVRMNFMFNGAENFNQDVSAWDVSKVDNFVAMFVSASAFDNGGVALDWTTLGQSPNVSTISMNAMFSGASAFNQDVSSWTVEKVENMSSMFSEANLFNQSLGNWDISGITVPSSMENMLNNTALSSANYDATLIGWADDNGGTETIPAGVTLGASGLSYCSAIAERAILTNTSTNNWTINDAGTACDEPSTQSSAITFSNVTSTQMDISWTSGNGNNRIVVVKVGSPVDFTPVDASSYTADTNFGIGIEYGSGNYVVYNGNGNLVTLTGLTVGETYHVQIYDYNGTSGIENYNTTVTSDNSANILIAPEIQVLNGAVDLTVNDEIDFGSIVESTSTSQTLTINNQGTIDLTISDIQLGTGTAYAISGIDLPITIASGNSTDFTITLSSVSAQTWTDALTLTSDDADESPFSLNLTGEVTVTAVPEIELLNGATNLAINAEIDFGSTLENTSTSQILTIRNSGTADLTISDIQLTTGTAYSISGITLPATIVAGNTVDFIITLSSDSVQTWTDILTITSDDADESPFILNLTGEIIATPNAEIQVQRENLPLNGIVELGNTEAGNTLVGTFDILNVGEADLIINNIVSSNDLFTISFGSLPATISANSSNSFDIELNSTIVGIFESKIAISSNDPEQDVFEFDVRAVVEGARVVLLITNPDNSIERIV
ncbi:surface protein, partial [Marivirga sericea]